MWEHSRTESHPSVHDTYPRCCSDSRISPNHDTDNRYTYSIRHSYYLHHVFKLHCVATMINGTGRIARTSVPAKHHEMRHDVAYFYTVYDCWIISTSKFFRRTTDSTCPFKVFNSRNLQGQNSEVSDEATSSQKISLQKCTNRGRVQTSQYSDYLIPE